MPILDRRLRLDRYDTQIVDGAPTQVLAASHIIWGEKQIQRQYAVAGSGGVTISSETDYLVRYAADFFLFNLARFRLQDDEGRTLRITNVAELPGTRRRFITISVEV